MVEIAAELELLRTQIKELELEKADLEVVVDNITAHCDGIESQLFLLNRQLKVEIRERQEKETSLRISEGLLKAINKSLQREKADLELILENTTEHGDFVESLSFSKNRLEQEQLFQAITESLPDGILLARENDWGILYANSAAVKLIDLPTEQIIGAIWGEFCQTISDFKQLQNLYLHQGYIQNHEMHLKQRFQVNICINLSLHSLQLGNQQVLLLSCQNISERRQIQDALQRSQLELKQHSELLELRVTERTQALQNALEAAATANKFKSQFLANMSHELRTPLNAILGFSSFLQQDEDLNDEQKESVNLINQSSEHLLALINDVLELSKIEAGRVVLKEQGFNLRQELAQIMQMLKQRSQQKGIELRLEISTEIPQLIVADQGKLSQVLINLLTNGIKFTEKGSVTLRLFPESAPIRNQIDLNFEVIDTGSGIDPKEIKFLFHEFSQTESGQQQKEGTGLGLAISQKFIRLMGGEITVSSLPNKGSIFSFAIRVAIAPSQSLEAQSDLKAESLDSNNPVSTEGDYQELASLKILLAEDNSVNLKIAMRMLSKLGYEADVCRNGREALAAHKANHYDLILMDVQMPELDGMAATKAIRQLEQTQTNAQAQSVVIIAMTAFGLAEDRRDCLEAGMDDYISKPVRQAELQTILKHWHKTVKYYTKSIKH